MNLGEKQTEWKVFIWALSGFSWLNKAISLS